MDAEFSSSEIKDRLSDLIKKLEKKVPYAAALHKKKTGTRVSVNRVQESVEPEDPSQGLVLTLWNGKNFLEYSTNGNNWKEIESEALTLAKRGFTGSANRRKKGETPDDIDPGPVMEKDFFTPVENDPVKLPLHDKLMLARSRLKTTLGMDPLVTNAISIVNDSVSEDIFVNRNKRLSQRIVRTDAIVVVFVSNGKNSADLHTGLSKNGGFEAVPLNEDDLRRLVADAKKLLEAPRLSPGLYDVVTDPDWSGIIAHECFGHGMETDLYVRERAMSRHYIGKPVASAIVNMFDDPTLIQESGGFFFDDEGQPATSTHIIKDGILQRGLTDLASAHTLRISRSANGRRESFARKAYARMTNTFFENGLQSKEEILRSVSDGYYLRHATNGMEDPQAWGIQVEGLWAEKIHNGRLTGEVYSPVIMTGFVPDLLKSISMVGNDRTISGLGMCGKGHKEWVKNTTGGPHLKMKARLA